MKTNGKNMENGEFSKIIKDLSNILNKLENELEKQKLIIFNIKESIKLLSNNNYLDKKILIHKSISKNIDDYIFNHKSGDIILSKDIFKLLYSTSQQRSKQSLFSTISVTLKRRTNKTIRKISSGIFIKI